MSVDVLILVLSNVTNLLIGAGVFLRGPKLHINKAFAMLSLSIVAWTSCNYIADNTSSTELATLFGRLTIIFGLTILLAVLVFSRVFPRGDLRHHPTLNNYQLPVIIGVILLSFTPLIIESVEPADDSANLITGPLYIVFILVLLQGIVIATMNFRQQYHQARSATEKSQVGLVLSGLMLYAIFTVGFNVFLPLILNDWNSSRYGPIFSLFLVMFSAYAIVKHRLFDIKLILARYLGYILSVGLLVLIYAVIFQGLIALLNDQFHNSSLNSAINVLLIVFVLVSFQPLKKSFDKTSNRLFYQDSYDPQQLLSQLNSNILNNVDVKPLLDESVNIINRHLKVAFSTIELRATSYSPQRMLGSRLDFNEDDTLVIRTLIAPLKKRVIITDDLRDSEPKLFEVLSKYDIAAVSKMASSMDYGQEGIGMMFFGIKKSGNAINKQDKDIVGIISSELTVATQNALRFEEIENFTVTLQEKVDDATNRLKKANDKLKLMDETKDEFISMASHQLRTPLTSVKGYVSMVLEGDAGPLNEMQTKLLEQSFTSSQRMVYLIADLLNLSRLKTGKFVIESKPTNLAEVIQGEVEQLTDTAAAKNLTLVYNRPKSFPELELDETKIRQVIMNFVDNAIYYTPAGGHIDIDLVENDKSVEFMVRDDGMGVPQAEQHHLFNKFFRAKNAQKARPDGTGLGLFMAKKVIVAQGGAIIFSSVVGKGSTFGFSFSKTKLQVDPPAPIAAETSATKA